MPNISAGPASLRAALPAPGDLGRVPGTDRIVHSRLVIFGADARPDRKNVPDEQFLLIGGEFAGEQYLVQCIQLTRRFAGPGDPGLTIELVPATYTYEQLSQKLGRTAIVRDCSWEPRPLNTFLRELEEEGYQIVEPDGEEPHRPGPPIDGGSTRAEPARHSVEDNVKIRLDLLQFMKRISEG